MINKKNGPSESKKDYNPNEIEPKWQEVWNKNKVYSPDLDTAKKPFYNLMMFPYPSAEGMHVGNMYAFTGADVYGRFMRMQGNDVFEPMGLDGFGIHSENYAIKIGQHPKDLAKVSEVNFYRQLRATGNGFDWSRKLETYDPNYYKWTQWLFIQLFKAGLAYRKKAAVNFCPSCKTVLADEQVIEGKCERCGTIVEKRELEQWFFRITKYADRLLNNIEKLDWTEKVKIAQRQWIGKSEGARIKFKVQSSKFKVEDIEVFTTRPDTLYGATFLVLAPEHPLVAELLKSKVGEVSNYVQEAKNKSEQERGAEGKEKTGVFSGLYAINPVNQEKIPIWIADYVLMGYGTGAIMAVPAHDQRDFEFAKKYNLDIKHVISSENEKMDKAYEEEGVIINSGEWNGLKVPQEIGKVIDWLEKKGLGKREANYHLRDWLISRQRYWGAPIPLVFCENCAVKIKNQKSPPKADQPLAEKIKNGEYSEGEIENPGWIAVKDKDLPVLLPDVKDWKPKGIHSTSLGQAVKSPLASAESFVNTTCPSCKCPAKRETDVSDTFLDSAWYFFRYVSTDIESSAFDIERVKKWLPVEMYIGGAEHSVLHLLYSRFITMVLKDLGFIEFEEPFSRFYAHGLLIKEGAKMSKSKGNVVIPDEYIKKYGADTLRCYLMFLGPFNQGGDFYDTGIEGTNRFVRRVWTLLTQNQKSKVKNQKLDDESLRMMHKTIKKATEDITNLRYNTAISALMEWYNYISKSKDQISNIEAENFLKLLAPFAPHMTEQLFQLLRSQKSKVKSQKFESIHLQPWPTYDPKFLVQNEVTVVVQVNGKVRETLKVQNSDLKAQSYVEQLARKSDKVSKYLEGKKIKKVVYIEGKVINFVID